MPDTRVIADFITCVYLGNQDQLKFTANAIEPSVEKPKKVTVPEIVEGPNKKTISEPKKDPSTGSGSNKSPETVKYKIKKGDTLTKIAAKYHVTIAELMKWNNLKNDNIREGQTLIIKK